MIKALKAGDKLRLTVLRSLKSDLKYKQISSGEELPDAKAMEVISTSAKRHRESIEQFTRGNRDDLVDIEKAELAVISEFLPEQLSEDELRQMAKDAVAESGADSPQKIGLVMKVIMPKIKGRADGKLVNKLIMELLAN